ncbi:MAG: hypothetical protein ABIH10_00490 [Spirochaetota bacterium]
MILTTHAIVGAAAGRIFSDPFMAFAAGFASHFILDAIPHWAYVLKFQTRNKKEPLKEDIKFNWDFVSDLARTGFDFVFGVSAAIFIFQGENGFIGAPVNLLMGTIGGVSPDFLQLLYFKIRREPFIFTQKIHTFFHLKEDIPILPYGIIS